MEEKLLIELPYQVSITEERLHDNCLLGALLKYATKVHFIIYINILSHRENFEINLSTCIMMSSIRGRTAAWG